MWLEQMPTLTELILTFLILAFLIAYGLLSPGAGSQPDQD